ncbi:5-methylcytosine-specific restriction enzyme A [Paenibacillus sp. RU4T]|nr:MULTISPECIES: HNH endonuclease [unclassified Paenibacillus]ASS66387.1 HNH endonuclease [Paenibacillus sp. RUD330]SIQ05988.1 5-methylcytosine-specific restriction enzyme A [Paenibacillus sp. RU4X]SIQ26123.1 5-methylcytosine-specific restriction enzyme A [Paenibacillus sp. RU4T]
MPASPNKPCSKPGCPALTTGRFCQSHTKQDDRQRGTAAQRGYDSKWRKARVGFLIKHPLCVTCTAEGAVGAATVVDHIVPHQGDKVLFWDRNNWQGLCKLHHDRKTAQEDGGFGNGKSM